MTERRDKTSSAMNAMTGSLDHLDNQRNAATLFADPNGNGRTTSQTSRGQLVHSVSIIVEPVLDDLDPSLEEEGKDHLQDRGEKESFLPNKDLRSLITTSDTTSFDSSQQRLLRKERIHSSPIIVLDDHFFESKDRSSDDESTVRSIIQTARLRKEEFARLLEEHAQLVNEINRVETSLV